MKALYNERTARRPTRVRDGSLHRKRHVDTQYTRLCPTRSEDLARATRAFRAPAQMAPGYGLDRRRKRSAYCPVPRKNPCVQRRSARLVLRRRAQVDRIPEFEVKLQANISRLRALAYFT